MTVSEFELIKKYFERKASKDQNVSLGIGDDAAIIKPAPGSDLVVAIDTLVNGVHFPSNTSAYDVGWKALAVNLSDIAAMGASPAWFTLAITLPDSSEDWLASFSQGIFDLADQYGLSLAGGDTTHGPLTISVQIAGYVPKGRAILRKGACVGDEIYVTGTIGDAALALSLLNNHQENIATTLLDRLNRPKPRINEGEFIRNYANCAIDISDGLVADIGHLLEHNQLGAEIKAQSIPLSATAQKLIKTEPELIKTVLAGGDDYELCFTVSPEQVKPFENAAQTAGFGFTSIGRITGNSEVSVLSEINEKIHLKEPGYQHFVKN